MVNGREEMVQSVVAEVGQSSEQRAVDSRTFSDCVQLSQTPVTVNSENVHRTKKEMCLIRRVFGGNLTYHLA